MTRKSAILALMSLCLCGSWITAAVQQPKPAAVAPSSSQYRALLDQYCVGCHNERSKTAGLTLDTMDLADVATLLETNRVKRVPVVRGGKIVGIVSRANLVRALAATRDDPAADIGSDDRTIRNKLLAELMGQEWFKAQQWFKIWAADVIVKDAVVHFWLSSDQTEEERRALCVAAENIAGVRRVEEHIIPAV